MQFDALSHLQGIGIVASPRRKIQVVTICDDSNVVANQILFFWIERCFKARRGDPDIAYPHA